MEWSEESDIEIEITRFVSRDGKHEVIWYKPETLDYEVWWCKTHQKAYYKSDCIDYRNSSPGESN